MYGEYEKHIARDLEAIFQGQSISNFAISCDRCIV